MGTFVLVPGAGGAAWYWHRVVPLLRAAGHDAIAVQLPGADPDAGLPEYTRVALDAIGAREDVTLVVQSLGGFTAPLVAAATPLRALVLVNAMIPRPGETPGAWWGATGWAEARVEAARRGGYATEFELWTYFLHDVPEEVARAGGPHQNEEADAVFGSACEFERWPPLPLQVIAGREDRFFPLEFQRAVARERLGVEPDALPGGHLIALSQPERLAERLLEAAP